MEEIACPFCESVACEVLTDNLIKCYSCEEIFEWNDEAPPPKQFRTKPRKKVDDNLDDGF